MNFFVPARYKRACLHALVDPRTADGEGNLHSVTQTDRQISENITTFLHRVECVVWNRRLFQAEPEGGVLSAKPTRVGGKQAKGIQESVIGIGPSGCEVGHMLCVLQGCSVPVVLGQSRRKGLFTVVGEAYVHGIMDGEVMDGEVMGARSGAFQDFLLE